MGANPSARADVVTAVFHKWATAIHEHRPQDVASVFTEDAIFQGFDESHAVGRSAVAEYYAKQPVGLSAAFRILELRSFAGGDLLAYLAVDFTRADGTVIPVHLTAIVRNIPGNWLISHYHVSKIERKTELGTPAELENIERNQS
jgi:uncharacterized protein (TIGR02246 family)